jgi:hypothetical protein
MDSSGNHATAEQHALQPLRPGIHEQLQRSVGVVYNSHVVTPALQMLLLATWGGDGCLHLPLFSGARIFSAVTLHGMSWMIKESCVQGPAVC